MLIGGSLNVICLGQAFYSIGTLRCQSCKQSITPKCCHTEVHVCTWDVSNDSCYIISKMGILCFIIFYLFYRRLFLLLINSFTFHCIAIIIKSHWNFKKLLLYWIRCACIQLQISVFICKVPISAVFILFHAVFILFHYPCVMTNKLLNKIVLFF